MSKENLKKAVDRFILLFDENWAKGFVEYNKNNKKLISEVVLELCDRFDKEKDSNYKTLLETMISNIKNEYEIQFCGGILK